MSLSRFRSKSSWSHKRRRLSSFRCLSTAKVWKLANTFASLPSALCLSKVYLVISALVIRTYYSVCRTLAGNAFSLVLTFMLEVLIRHVFRSTTTCGEGWHRCRVTSTQSSDACQRKLLAGPEAGRQLAKFKYLKNWRVSSKQPICCKTTDFSRMVYG